jgi:hypothetical protein
MPVRVPQTSLAPQLRARHDADSQPVARQATGPIQRSPEATRDMLISMQEGWERGRLDELDDLDDLDVLDEAGGAPDKLTGG